MGTAIAGMMASVADVLTFESLPDETKASLIRLIGYNPTAHTGLPPTRDELEEAYDAGYEEARQALDYPNGFDRWISDRKRK